MDLLQIFHHFPQFPPADILEGQYHTQNGKVNSEKRNKTTETIKHSALQLESTLAKKQLQRLSEILTPLGCQDMDVGMEVDAISESLGHRHHSWHELMACDGPKNSQNNGKAPGRKRCALDDVDDTPLP